MKLILGFLRIVNQILASLKHAEILEKSLLPALLWSLYFENNIGPARCTSSKSSAFSFGKDI